MFAGCPILGSTSLSNARMENNHSFSLDNNHFLNSSYFRILDFGDKGN